MVYGPNARALKHVFWEELKDCVGISGIPGIICRDFNATFDVGDKISGPPNLEDITNANAFLQDLVLQEPPSFGKRFSWTNGQASPIWVKLDYFLVNSVCVNTFPKMI